MWSRCVILADVTASAPTAPRPLRLLASMVAILALAGCGRAEAGSPEVTSSTLSTTVSTLPPSTAAPTTTTTAAPVSVTYVIQSGDSLGIIAERFGISLSVLADFNAISDPNTIYVGQEIVIPPADATTTTAASSTTAAG